MSAAGCRQLRLGFESGSGQILKNLNKHSCFPSRIANRHSASRRFSADFFAAIANCSARLRQCPASCLTSFFRITLGKIPLVLEQIAGRSARTRIITGGVEKKGSGEQRDNDGGQNMKRLSRCTGVIIVCCRIPLPNFGDECHFFARKGLGELGSRPVNGFQRKNL